ncbi:MAG: pyruvate dehydrogenase (acetyl-transferring) E1 component subunit alpha [Spirochaetia bacterium]|jgi:pyruvate dehydrogenase E1 component alpha subunit
MGDQKRERASARLEKDLLGKMLLIRRFEEKAAQMYGLKKIGGFCHLYIGQEAAGVGAISAIDLARDYTVGAYRDHGYALACGMDPRGLMAELFGKATGSSKGKGGSMHFFDAGRHMFGGNGIVGAQIPVATGVALKCHYRKDGGLVLCWFGDGAIHQGSFHESLNMAKIWNLPIIYICENNQYGMGTDFRRVSSVTDFVVMGHSYGIPGKQVNGMDVMEVYREVKEAAARVRTESTPMFLEIKTYRYRGHSMSDPAKYRTPEELESYKKQDPLLIMKSRMEESGTLSQDQYEAMDAECKALCDDAVKFAEESPEPEPSALYEDVLA